MSILNNLYSGNISPAEKFIKRNSEYYKQNQRVCELVNKITLTLNNQEKKFLDEILEQEIRLCAICEEERYIDGFNTGVKMMIEVFNYKSANFK